MAGFGKRSRSGARLGTARAGRHPSTAWLGATTEYWTSRVTHRLPKSGRTFTSPHRFQIAADSWLPIFAAQVYIGPIGIGRNR